MKTTRLLPSLLCASALLCGPAVPRAAEPGVPPLVKQLNNGNWLPQAEAEALRDELFYQRAIHAYMTMQPALNTIGMRDGSEATSSPERKSTMRRMP